MHAVTFVQFCEAHGLIMGGSLIEGRWVRVKTEDKKTKRNGAYKFMGDHGFCQNHATMTQVASWFSESCEAVVVDTEAIAARRKAEREDRMRAIHRARAFWTDSRPLSRLHPYLAKKGLSALGCSGLRENDGFLVVPVMWGDKLLSTQTIHPDGTKRFFAGAPVKAGACVIDRPGAAVTVIVEGLATGLAVFQSVRQSRVIVAFDAGNLLAVVERIRPSGSVVIAADNDHATQARRGFNPGREKAANAAELIGCGVAWPEGIEGTDFADMLVEMGQGAHRKVERTILAGARYVAGVV